MSESRKVKSASLNRLIENPRQSNVERISSFELKYFQKLVFHICIDPLSCCIENDFD